MEATGTDTSKLGAIGLVAETSCKYFKALSFPDRLEAGMRIEKLGNSSVIYQIGLYREQETELAALAKFVHVYVDAQTRKSVPIPEVIRVALAPLA
jgi:acyl-CoA thioester hydrolase